jgi:hypothetical protein
MTADRIQSMTLKERKWWFKRLQSQKQREADEIEKATKNKGKGKKK